MKILLMNGHGAGDSGATGNGYKECDLTRELADLVESKLKKYATVVRYPKSRNAFADVESGSFKSHVSGGVSNIDYAFEIHFNAYKKDETKDGKMKGSECYVTTRESGITVEQAIMKNLSDFFPLRDNDNVFDGVKRTNFLVINTLKDYGVSGALLETCFIDDADDIATYKSNKDKIAQAIVDGIAEGFGLKKTSGSSTSEKPSSTSNTYKLVTSCKVYNTAADAKNRKNAVTTYSAGTYYIFNEANGMINVTKDKGEPGGWINPADNKKSSGSTSTSKKKSVYLPASAKSWRVYKTSVAPVVGNECGFLYPSKFGGLTYEILATPQTDVVTIQTRDYGKVNIYVAKSTGAVIK